MRKNVGQDDLILVLKFVVTQDVSTDPYMSPHTTCAGDTTKSLMQINVGQDDLILVLTFVVTHEVSTDQLSYPYNL